MEKDILLAVMKRLGDQVQEFKWIDLESGQLNAAERPPIATPACLLDMAYIACDQLASANQRVTVEIRLTMVFATTGTTSVNTPAEVRERAMKSYDIANKVHQVLHWWTNEGVFLPLRRMRITPRTRADGLRVFDAVYQLVYIDGVATQMNDG